MIRPLAFVRVAVTVALLAGSQIVIALLLVQAAIVDSVAPRLDAVDDTPWLTHAAPVASSALEAVEGARPETVIARLGAPVRVRRDRWRLPDRCAQAYVYPARTGGELVGVGLCITDAGLVSGSIGSAETLTFDLHSMADSAPDMFASALWSSWMAVPFAFVLRAWRVRRPIRLTTLKLASA